MNIVIVEDDEKIANFLSKGLKSEGYATVVIGDGDEAMTKVPSMGTDIDLVLLDLSLPGADGKTVLSSWRANGFTQPVIILTARDETKYKIEGLDAGANDYVTKPFSFAELLARRASAPASNSTCDSWELSPERLVTATSEPTTFFETVTGDPRTK